MGLKSLPEIFFTTGCCGKKIPWASTGWESILRGEAGKDFVSILRGKTVGWLFDNGRDETVLMGRIIWYEDGERLKPIKLPRVRNSLEPGQKRAKPRPTPKRKMRPDCPKEVVRNPDMLEKGDLLVMAWGCWQVVQFGIAKPVMRVTPEHFAGMRYRQWERNGSFYGVRSDILAELMTVYGLSSTQALVAFNRKTDG